MLWYSNLIRQQNKQCNQTGGLDSSELKSLKQTYEILYTVSSSSSVDKKRKGNWNIMNS